jgi:hypothetical protein
VLDYQGMVFLGGNAQQKADLDKLHNAFATPDCERTADENALLTAHDGALSVLPLESLMFVSVSSHKGRAPTYKDDLESLGYSILYLLRGSLPCQWFYDDDAVAARNDMLSIKRHFLACSRLKGLFGGIPSTLAMEKYFKRCKMLGYGKKPDYE